jgi:SAM-dependent methyltransferase
VKQKEIFLQSEGDAWFTRNRKVVAGRNLPNDDALLRELLDLPLGNTQRLKVLEVGCGDGTRLAWIKNNLNADCYGVEPSMQAVAAPIPKASACGKAQPMRYRSTEAALILLCLVFAFIFVTVKICFALPLKLIACCARRVG